MRVQGCIITISKQSNVSPDSTTSTPFKLEIYVADARNSGYTCYHGRAHSMLESSFCRSMVVSVKLDEENEAYIVWRK